MTHLTNYLLHSDNNPPSQKPKTQPSTSKKAANAYTLTCNPGGTPERHTTSNEGRRVPRYHLGYGTGKILFIAKHLEISKIPPPLLRPPYHLTFTETQSEQPRRNPRATPKEPLKLRSNFKISIRKSKKGFTHSLLGITH